MILKSRLLSVVLWRETRADVRTLNISVTCLPLSPLFLPLSPSHHRFPHLTASCRHRCEKRGSSASPFHSHWLTKFSQRLRHRPVDRRQHVCVDDVEYRGHVDQSLGQQGVPVVVQLLRPGLAPVEPQHPRDHHPCRRGCDRAGDTPRGAGLRGGLMFLKHLCFTHFTLSPRD